MQVDKDQKSASPAFASGGAIGEGGRRASTEAQVAEPHIDRTHAKLLAGMRNRDREALAMVVQQFSPSLTRAAYLYLADGHDAEDAVQETFLAAWGAAKRTTTRTNLSHWLFGILMNRCRKHIRTASRRRRRDRRAFEDRQAALQPAAVGARAQREEELTRVQDALASLSAEHREAVILRYYQGLSVTQAGEAMGVPPGTVKSRCHVALTKLRAIIEDLP